MLDPEFSPTKMAILEPEARALVNEIIDRFADKGSCEFHEDFATPLPSTIFLALIGLPQSDLPDFLRWRDDTIRPEGKIGKGATNVDCHPKLNVQSHSEARNTNWLVNNSSADPRPVKRSCVE